jgi:hypothetical protein
MIRFLKNLMPRAPLPASIHFHLDEHGNEVWCDESVCRPASRRPSLLPPLH